MHFAHPPSDSPLFNDPALSSLRRVGVVDVGSNSVRLVVFDGAARSPAYFFNEKVLCGLGSSLALTGKLNPDGRERALAAIKRFALLAESMNLSTLIGVGTAAVREAEDGKDFCELIEQTTGLRVAIASGAEEARLAAQGVLLGWPGASGIVCDLGGYSAEFAEISNGRIGKCLTSPLGPLAVQQAYTGGKAGKRKLAEIAVGVRSNFNGDVRALHLVGGSWRVIARLHMEHWKYPLKVLNEYRMTPDSVRATLKWARRVGVKGLRERNLVNYERLQLLPLAGRVLEAILNAFEPNEISVSAHGIREGLLYGYMPERLRNRDPLIEACIHSEHSSARQPGFGEKLFEFVKPLFKEAGTERLRLIRAACLLHDVTWRAHPDYRAEISFDNATRSNLGGLDHSGRVFLALALFHRYRSSNGEQFIGKYLSLLPKGDAKQAEILGRAMRFGAMFAVVSPEKIARLKFKSRRNSLILILPASFSDIYGVAAEVRFRSLARAMDCAPEVEVV